MSGQSIIGGSNVHMEIGIARRKNAVVVLGIESDDFNRVLLDHKTDLGFLV